MSFLAAPRSCSAITEKTKAKAWRSQSVWYTTSISGMFSFIMDDFPLSGNFQVLDLVMLHLNKFFFPLFSAFSFFQSTKETERGKELREKIAKKHQEKEKA